MAYNIKDGGLGREDQILDVLQAVHPDVIMLEEVYEATPLKQWAEALDMAFVRARGNTRRHLGLLSRVPIEASASFHPNPPIHTTVLEAELRLSPEKSVRLYGVHLLAGPFVAMELWRIWELAVILRRTRTHSATPCLMIGDFNAIAPGDPVDTRDWPTMLKVILALQAGHVFHGAIRRVLNAGFVDCYRQLQPDEAGFTLPAPAPNARLDYSFANAALIGSLRSCKDVREPPIVMTASDHRPLLTEFDL